MYSGSLACLQSVAQAFISSALGTSATWFQLLPFYSCHWRKAVREKLDIGGHPGTDFASHYFCMPCSLCQEHVSLKREIFHAQMMAQQSGGQPAYVGYGHGGQVALQPQPAYYGQAGTVAIWVDVALKVTPTRTRAETLTRTRRHTRHRLTACHEGSVNVPAARIRT